MEKKHASCMDLHTSRNVKLLIEKFEGMCECRVHPSEKTDDCNMESLSGRVAETVAKFEHGTYLGHRYVQMRLSKTTCGDQATDLCLDNWKLQLCQLTEPTESTIQIEELPKAPDEAEEIEQQQNLYVLDRNISSQRMAMECSSTNLSPVSSLKSFERDSPLMLCSLSRQVMRSVCSCGEAIVALGKWLAQILGCVPPLNGSESFMQKLYLKAKSARKSTA